MDYYRSAIHKVKTALSLSRGDWAVFIHAWSQLLLVDLLLRSRPYKQALKYVDDQGKPQMHSISSAQAWEIIRRDQRLVILASRYHLYKMECLRQALTLKGLLGAQGLHTEICFGVKKTETEFLAHAWLEYEDQTIELSDGNGYEKLLQASEKLP
jgi:Transglutaminase-like superfamily